MILTKNRLKKIRKTIDDDDMLNYLKYSHLDFFDKNKDKSFEDKATQFPEMMNKSTQTKDTADKGVDTYDDLNVVVGDYDLYGTTKNFDKNEKMVQVNTLKRTNPNSPPSSSSSSSSDGGEGFVSRNVRRGFRLAEFALNTAITGANISMAVGDTIADLVFAPQAEVEEHQQQQQQQQQEQQQEIISVNSSPPQTISSSSSGVEEVIPLIRVSSGSSSRHTQTTIPQPTSPQSTPASSAKTTPRKKSK